MEKSAKKHILFSVAGKTPAVITETLFGLHTQGVTGGEVHILTTSDGKKALAEYLLEEDGQVAAFNRAYDTQWEICYDWIETVMPAGDAKRSGKRLPPVGLQVPGKMQQPLGQRPRPLADLRNTRDNAAAADAILDRVRRFTDDDSIILHASVAGGRKTMGLFLSQAMSWLARAEDDLSHVLVEPELEKPDKHFFFPLPGHPEHQGVVDYAPLRFVKLRGVLPDLIRGAQGGERSFSQLVDLSQVYLDDALEHKGALILDRVHRTLTLRGVDPIPLQPLSVGLYEFLFKHANVANGQEPFAFANAFAYRERLAECLAESAPELTGETKERGLSALQLRMDPNEWPERWAGETGTIVEEGKEIAVVKARIDELSYSFSRLETKDFKALPWDNASFRVLHEHEGKGRVRYVDIAPGRLEIVG